MRASVIIPTRGNIPFASNCLESLLETLTPDDEIIVVANGSEGEKAVTTGYVQGLALATKNKETARIRALESDPPGYGPAINLGLAKAEGKFLIIGNDDAVFAKRWLDEMIEALVRATITCPDVNWAFVGPHSNCALPVQTLPADHWPMAHDPARRDETVDVLANGNHPTIVPVGALSGFCLLITREAYTVLGGLDLDLAGTFGFTDNDWQLRGQEKGFLGLLAPRSFVFHAGHKSMDRYIPGHRGGVENTGCFLRKWYRPRKRFLCLAYRVQINTEHDLKLFAASLERSRAVADACVILDDRSTIPLLPWLTEIGLRDWVKCYTRNPDDAPFDEVRDRNAVIQLARSTNPDWILNLDHDEVLAENVTADDLQALMNPVDPAIKCYVFPIYTFWRGTTHVRLDSVWGSMTLSTLFKNDPCWGGIYQQGRTTGFHCRRVPTFIPTDAMSPTKRLIVRHYGYTDPSRAAEKRAYYVKNDTDKIRGLVGTENYEHLTDETQLCLVPYSTPSLTVALMAKNEAFDIARHLRMWSSFADELLIVDTGATDDTVALAESLGARVVRYRCCDKAEDPDHLICDFAKARNFTIQQATGDYILFLDPDEELDSRAVLLLPKALLQQADIYMMEIDNLVPQPDGSVKPWRSRQGRLFRRDARIYYSDDTHETLAESLRLHPELTVTDTNLMIRHFGFLNLQGEARDRKNRRYAERLADLLDKDPTNAVQLYNLASHLTKLGRYDKADRLLERVIELAPGYFAARWELALHYAGYALRLLLTTPKHAIPTPQSDLGEVSRMFVADMTKYVPEVVAGVANGGQNVRRTADVAGNGRSRQVAAPTEPRDTSGEERAAAAAAG